MPSTDEIVTELRSILADLQGIDLWPPWDAAQTVVSLVSRAVTIASSPPAPSPEVIEDVADEWHLIGIDAQSGRTALEELRAAVTTTIWEGSAGASFRASVTNLSARLESVPTAAHAVEAALRTLGTAMTAARARHEDAFDALHSHLTFSWSDLNPFALKDKVAQLVEDVIGAVQDLIGAYGDAAAAHAVARKDVVAAMDEIEFPDHLPSGVPSVIDIVNSWDDDHGPLDGSTLSQYDDALAKLSPEERANLEAALTATSDPTARAWIMAAVASGLTGEALRRYIKQVQGMRFNGNDPLDPTGFRGDDAQQPDQTTCGSSTLVMSKMENDPAYAMWMLTGYNPETGETDPRSPDDRFADESERMHLRTNLPISRDHDAQFPWPPQLGTQPWALAEEMSADGGSGVPGTDYGVSLVDPHDRGDSFDALVAANEDGHTVPIYVGDDTRPGHVALVTASSGDTLTVYEPASGQSVTVTRDEWTSGTMDVGGWGEPWAVVVPSGH